MTKQEKARRIGKILDRLYPSPEIPLQHADPFTLCIAVLLSAQTTDKAVNRVTPELFRQAPNPQAMARMTPKAIENLIRTVGLAPTKSRNIHLLSQRLLELHGGLVPDNLETLETLPGVGHKTASVVLVQAFGQPAFPVDTHIHRLAKRWGLSSGKNVVQTETDLKRLFPREEWGRRHLQFIYYGREFCPARGHDNMKCPLCREFGSRTKTDPT